jgi:ferredoxin
MWPNITVKIDPLPEAAEFDGKPDKMQYFSETPGEGS